MKNNIKTIWKIIVILIAAGLILAIIGFSLGASRSLYIDRTGVHVSGNETTYISEHDLASFSNIVIDAGFIDVEFFSSNAYGIEISSDNADLRWTVESDTLTVSLLRSSRVQIMSFDFSSSNRNYIRVLIPDDAIFDTVDARTSSGDIKIGDIKATSVEINSTTGNIIANNIVSLRANVQTTSGNIRLSGDFFGNTEVHARTGDVRVSASGDKNDYSFRLSTRTGTIRSDGERLSNEIADRPTRENHISITTTSGNIEVNFGN